MYSGCAGTDGERQEKKSDAFGRKFIGRIYEHFFDRTARMAEEKWIEPQRAEQGLFSLAMGYLSKKDFDESFRHAMGFASEMEAANRRLVIYAK